MRRFPADRPAIGGEADHRDEPMTYPRPHGPQIADERALRLVAAGPAGARRLVGSAPPAHPERISLTIVALWLGRRGAGRRVGRSSPASAPGRPARAGDPGLALRLARRRRRQADRRLGLWAGPARRCLLLGTALSGGVLAVGRLARRPAARAGRRRATPAPWSAGRCLPPRLAADVTAWRQRSGLPYGVAVAAGGAWLVHRLLPPSELGEPDMRRMLLPLVALLLAGAATFAVAAGSSAANGRVGRRPAEAGAAQGRAGGGGRPRRRLLRAAGLAALAGLARRRRARRPTSCAAQSDEAAPGRRGRAPAARGRPAVTAGSVVKPGERGFLAAVLEPGMRAISVPVDEAAGNAGLIFPGDRVDLILTQTIECRGRSRRARDA